VRADVAERIAKTTAESLIDAGRRNAELSARIATLERERRAVAQIASDAIHAEGGTIKWRNALEKIVWLTR
jgi:hypothetical protein